MSNPPITDTRFNKTTHESLVDLINFSNKTFIRYNEIEIVAIEPIPGNQDEVYNSTVTIKLANSSESAPTYTLSYHRFEISDYLPQPAIFIYDGLEGIDTFFTQLKQELHRIWLNADDCSVEISEQDSNGAWSVIFTPMINHPIWTGQLHVTAVPSNHLSALISNTELDGFTLEQLSA